MATKCILCSHLIDASLGYFNIAETIVQSSKKTLKNILTHLSKCIKSNCNFDDSSFVCNPCYEKLVEYDRIMMELLMHQRELSSMLEESIKFDDNEPKQEYNIELGEDFASDCSRGNDNVDDFNEDSIESTSDSTPLSSECSICQGNAKSKNSVCTHTTAVKCDTCGVFCRDEEYLELHMNLHEGKTENDCRYCPKRYSRRANVIRHMQLHWDKKKFQCEKCGLRFSQTNILYNHKMIHEAEEEPLICKICDQTFKSKKTFRHHMIIHREDRPMHPCEICGKKFTEKYTLKMHLKTHIDSKEDESEALRKKYAKYKIFPCIICEKNFKNTVSLEAHRATEHDVIGLTQLKTNIDGKEEESEALRKKYAKYKIFPCIICEKNFKNTDSLEAHRAKEHDVIGLNELF